MYINDLLMFFSFIEKHIEHVKLMLQRLKQFNLCLKFNKCSFHVFHVNFLDFRISFDDITMQTNKIIVVKDWSKSKSHKDMYSSKWCDLNSHQFTVIQTDVSCTVNFQKFNSIHFFRIIVIFLRILIKFTLKKWFILLIILLNVEIYNRIKKTFRKCNNFCNNSFANKHIDREFCLFYFVTRT
jgi:hypothetical protein